jgi:hypothetical protein
VDQFGLVAWVATPSTSPATSPAAPRPATSRATTRPATTRIGAVPPRPATTRIGTLLQREEQGSKFLDRFDSGLSGPLFGLEQIL